MRPIGAPDCKGRPAPHPAFERASELDPPIPFEEVLEVESLRKL